MFNEQHSSSQKKSKFEYEIPFIHFSNKTFLFGMYTKLLDFENHFEVIATRYRNIALTWLLATYAGIGFLLSGETETLIIDHVVSVVLMSFIGMIGITLIGHLDINIYNRFWSALFIEEIIMEERYPFLPKTQKTTLLIDKKRNNLFSHGWLYFTEIFLLIITAGVALCTLKGNLSWNERMIWLFALLIFSGFLLGFLIKSGNDAQKALYTQLENRRKQIEK
jgi:hypothetical protein